MWRNALRLSVSDLTSRRGTVLYHLCGGEFVLEERIDVAGTLVVQACGIVLYAFKCLRGIKHIYRLLRIIMVIVHKIPRQLRTEVILH